MLDLNKNGTLSKTELEAAFPVLGIKVWNKDVVKMLSLVDKDKNGQIDYEEFVNFIYNYEADVTEKSTTEVGE